MKTLRLWTAFLRIEVLLLRRNPLEAVGIAALGTVAILGLFFGIRIFAPSVASSAQSQGAILSGLLVLTLTTQTYQAVAYSIQTAASNGTLEQLAMSPFGLWRVLVLNVGATLVQNLVVLVPVLLVVGVASREPLNLDLLSLLPLFLLLLVGLTGIALLLGGATLLYKRMQIVQGMVVLPLLALVSLPVGRLWLFKLLPVALPNTLIREVWVGHRGLWQLPPTDLLLAAGMAVVYGWGGVMVFKLLDRRARDRGVLGQY